MPAGLLAAALPMPRFPLPARGRLLGAPPGWRLSGLGSERHVGLRQQEEEEEVAAAVRRRRLLPSQLRPRGAEPPPHRAPASAAPAPGRAGREWRPGCGGAPQPRCHTDEAARDVPPRSGPPRALSQCPGLLDTLSHRAGPLRRCHGALSPSSTLSQCPVPLKHSVTRPCPLQARCRWALSYQTASVPLGKQSLHPVPTNTATAPVPRAAVPQRHAGVK